MNKKSRQVIAIILGTLFIAVSLIGLLINPCPTKAQYPFFRVWILLKIKSGCNVKFAV